MITGFNTDIEHGGVTYHVQTEDKGLETPLILSLVYVGGAIIASKRTSKLRPSLASFMNKMNGDSRRRAPRRAESRPARPEAHTQEVFHWV